MEGNNMISTQEIKDILKKILIEKIEIEVSDSDFEKKFIDIGLNSLLFIKLLVNIETQLEIEFEEEFIDINYLFSLDQLVEHIKILLTN